MIGFIKYLKQESDLFQRSNMEVFVICIIIFLILYLIFKHLLSQSKRPTGIIGLLMMRMWNNAYLPMSEWSLSFLNKKNYDHVLDIGIGNGATTKYISDNLYCKSVTGIDISDKAIEQAKIHNLRKNIRFEKRDIKATQYPSEYFDLICAFQNHFHWENLHKSFMEIKRIMSNDGILLIGCEYAKIKYFLPDLKSKEAFEIYLDSLNLKIIQAKENKGWIFYKIMKK